MTATAEKADPAMSSVKREESNSGEFLKVVKSEEEDGDVEGEDAPLSTPFVTGLIKQEDVRAATELGTDSEAPAPSDLKKETCEVVNGEMREVEHDYVEAVGMKDVMIELSNESGEISGTKFQTEGFRVKGDSLDVLELGDEEVKPLSSSDVSESQMECVEQVSVEEKVLDDASDNEDGLLPGWEAKVVPDEEEPAASGLVVNIPLESKMEEVRPKAGKLAAPELENDDDNDGPPPLRDSIVIKEEVEAVTAAPVESIMFELKTKDVRAAKGTFPSPCLENDDDADGPPPGWEERIIENKVEPVPPASVESIQFETKMEEVWPTEDTLSAPGLENGYDAGPLPGCEAMVIKDEPKSVPSAYVESIKLESNMEEMRSEDTLCAPGLKNDDDADGPPPGWEATDIKEEIKLVASTLIESSQLEIQAEEELPTMDKLSAPGLENTVPDDGPPPGWEAVDTKESDVGKELIKLEKGKENAERTQEEEEQPPGMESEAHTAPRPSLPYEASSPTTEMGQVVCGSCRSLLSYPMGAKYVQCLCCQTVSFVLEAHQVGQVYCGGCSVLLMYRFGSRAVKCSGCKYITQITPHNQRPPLSEQGVTLQSQLAQLRPRPTTNLGQ